MRPPILATSIAASLCNVTDREACQRAARQAIEAFGQIDILINNAGITQPVKTMDITEADWRRIVDVNMTGVLFLSQAFIPHMRERKQGSIACMSSVSAQRGGGVFGGPHYSAAKAGVLGLAKAMARELGPDGIRVNSVTPGLIQTDITGGKLTDEMRTEILKGIPLNRLGNAEDVANIYLFLASDLVRLRHRRRDRRQRRHADPLSCRRRAELQTTERKRRWKRKRRSRMRRAWRNAPTASGGTRFAWVRCRDKVTSPRRSGSPTCWRSRISTPCGIGRRIRIAEDRDRFLLSIGHYAIALYAVLIEAGIIPQHELETYGSDDSRLPMSGMASYTPGMEISGGSLGIGLGIAVGIGLGLKRKKSDRFVYNLMSDGELDEGPTWEAAMSAGHWKLDNLICIVDVNRMQADGPSPSVLNSEPLAPKWEAFGWHVQRVDGNDIEALVSAFDAARSTAEPKPRIIICDTKMAKGVPFLEAREKSHFLRVEQDEWAKALEALDNGRHA